MTFSKHNWNQLSESSKKELKLREAFTQGRQDALNEQFSGGAGGKGKDGKGPRLTTHANAPGPGGNPSGGGGTGGGGVPDWPIMQLIFQYYGQQTEPNGPAPSWLDLDGDGVVGVGDVLQLISNGGGFTGPV